MALGTAVLVISAIVVAVLSALNNAQFSKSQNQATSFAREGLEIVSNLALSNWDTFTSNYPTGSYCLDQNSSTLIQKNGTVQGCEGTGETSGQNVYPYAREVDIEQSSSSCNATSPYGTKVTTTVSWSDSKCTNSSNLYCHQVQLVSCVTDNSNTGSP